MRRILGPWAAVLMAAVAPVHGQGVVRGPGADGAWESDPTMATGGSGRRPRPITLATYLRLAPAETGLAGTAILAVKALGGVASIGPRPGEAREFGKEWWEDPQVRFTTDPANPIVRFGAAAPGGNWDGRSDSAWRESSSFAGLLAVEVIPDPAGSDHFRWTSLPEPGTAGLALIGIAWLGVFRRRRAPLEIRPPGSHRAR